MKYRAPRSFAIGPYTVREDNGTPLGTDGNRIARVFTGSVAIFHGTLLDALAFAVQRRPPLSDYERGYERGRQFGDD